MPRDRFIEEYKSVRTTIFEADKTITNLIIYTVLSSATLLGFALQYNSPYLFLLPVTIILSLGYKIQSLQNDILWTGTYISTCIESQDKNLNYETFLKKIRRKKASDKPKKLRQYTNYLTFDVLGILCVLGSIFSVMSLDNNILTPFTNFNINNVLEFIVSNSLLVFLWIIIGLFFLHWTLRMRDCYSAKYQNNYENEILAILKTNEKENNTKK